MGYTRQHLSKHDTDRQTYMEEYDLSPDKLIAKDFRVIRSSLPGFYPHGIGVPQVMENIGATRRSRTGDLLITNQKKVMTLTKKTQAFPVMLRRYELDHWACMGLLASSSRTKGGQLSTLTA